MRKNIIWNILEVASSGLAMFFLYKFIVHILGVASLGVWSLVLASTALARFADLGAAGGLSRYVALHFRKDEPSDKALVYSETAFFLNLGIFGIVAALIYIPSYLSLRLGLHGNDLAQGRALLPYSLISFVLINVSSVISAGLIGLHRSYVKSLISIGSTILQIAVAYVATPRIGLSGIAVAQIVQNAFFILLGWTFLVKSIRGRLSLTLPHRFDVGAFRELAGFGIKLQVLNAVSFVYEPLTKFAISAVGGVAILGCYELASRVVMQLRQLILAPSTNLTPLFASNNLSSPGLNTKLYEGAVLTCLVAGGSTVLALLILAPTLCHIWLGHYPPLLPSFIRILAIGWFFNVLSAPAFLLGIGLGRFTGNMVGSSVMTLFSPALLYIFEGTTPLAYAFGPAIAVTLGAILTIIINAPLASSAAIPNVASLLQARVFLSGWSLRRGRVGALLLRRRVGVR